MEKDMRCSIKSSVTGVLCAGIATTLSPDQILAAPLSIASPAAVNLSSMSENVSHRHHYRGYQHGRWRECHRRHYRRCGYRYGPGGAVLGAALGIAAASNYYDYGYYPYYNYEYPHYGYGYGYPAYSYGYPVYWGGSLRRHYWNGRHHYWGGHRQFWGGGVPHIGGGAWSRGGLSGATGGGGLHHGGFGGFHHR
jgi:hypothetical protein